MTVVNSTSALIGRYGTEMTGRHLNDHGVISPLGLWLLLALAAPMTSGPHRDQLEAVLGTGARDAAAVAAAMLDEPHPAVATAVALWTQPDAFAGPHWQHWCDQLPTLVQTGAVPTQKEADQWAGQHTKDLITTFPADIQDSVLVLASALASRISWTHPFEDATPAELGGPFGATATRALRTPEDGHPVFLAHTQAAGLVGVHTGRSTDGLLVVSVIGDQTVPAATMHEAAQQVAAMLSWQPDPGAEHVDLFDVPVGTGHAWELTETLEPDGDSPQQVSGEAVLPVWSATSKHDLTDEPGIAQVTSALDAMVAPQLAPLEPTVTQAAVASFGKEGFSAAAVTAMAFFASNFRAPEVSWHRHLRVQFNRPYAVVAVAMDRAPDPAQGWRNRVVADPVWAGVPVFHAWVAHPA